MFRRKLSGRPVALVEPLESRSLFDATVADSPVQHPADVQAALMYPTPTPPTVNIASGAAGSEDPADITRPEIGPVPVEFVVSRSGGTMGMGDLDVAYVFVADTAIAGDFTNPSGMIRIPNGQPSVVLKIYVIDDAALEPPTETFFIELGPPPVPGSYVFANPGAPPKAAGAVADNDYEIKTAELGFPSQTIQRDDGSGPYTQPQWLDVNGDRDAVDAGEKRFPISYVRSRPGNETRVAVDLKLTVDGKLNGKYLIKGAGIGLPGGVMLEKELTIAPGTTVLETSITSSAALGNVIAKGVLTINWTITHLGQEKGYKSDHPTYVTGAPASGQFETVLDVGCRNATGLRPADTGDLEPLDKNQQVVNAIWNDFSDDLSVAAADGTVMQYAHDAPRFETAHLVKDKKGACGAWARFLVDVLTAQGISASGHEVEPSDPGIPGHTLADRPGAPGERGGQLRVNAGPAQGTAGANYPNREFEDHRIVKVQGIIWDRNVYDPSYGRRFEAMTVQAAEQAWEDASVEAYRYYLRNDATGEETYHGWFLDTKGVDEVEM